MKIQSFSLQGRRSSNEDQHFHLINLDNTTKKLNKINFVGVFDGHGGKAVSKYLKNNIPKYFIYKIEKNMFKDNKQTTRYIKNAFKAVQDKLQEDHPRASLETGSTCIVGIQTKKDLWIANVGDSRAVMCNKDGKAKQLSIDHKPNSSKEKKRIEGLNGKITFDGSDFRIKGYSLSRAFGDINAKPFISHLPQVFKYNLDKDKFAIFACDGLWDVFTNQEAVNYVNTLINEKYTGNIAKALAEEGYNKGSYDNISVVILYF